MSDSQQRYRVVEKLESGGMAEVFRAESEGLQGFRYGADGGQAATDGDATGRAAARGSTYVATKLGDPEGELCHGGLLAWREVGRLGFVEAEQDDGLDLGRAEFVASGTVGLLAR